MAPSAVWLAFLRVASLRSLVTAAKLKSWIRLLGEERVAPPKEVRGIRCN